MKSTGAISLTLGLFMTLYKGFSYVTRERVVDLGKFELTKEKQHTVRWQPYVGIGLMAIGGAILMPHRNKY